MKKYALWIASGIVTLVLLMGGGMKLSGQEMALKSFADLGLPAWFGTFIGACEIAGAIGIWLPRLSSLAALGISIIMIGAVYYHIVFPPIPAAIPALVVLLCAVYIFLRRKPEAFWSAGPTA